MKTLIIMRGLPGSGKSFKAEALQKAYSAMGYNVNIVSADHFFTCECCGNYKFDASRLQDAHKACQSNAGGYMNRAVPPDYIIVDNTNCQEWEYKPYMDKAAEHGYAVRFEYPETDWAWDVEECHKRCTHNVPLDKIQTMLNRFEK